MRGALAREETAQRNRVWVAWHTAALGRVKKMPKMAELMPRERPRKQTVRQMIDAALLIDARVNAKRK